MGYIQVCRLNVAKYEWRFHDGESYYFIVIYKNYVRILRFHNSNPYFIWFQGTTYRLDLFLLFWPSRIFMKECWEEGNNIYYSLHCTVQEYYFGHSFFLCFKLIWYNFHWRLCESTRNENTTSPTGVKMYDWVAWFARFQWFSYLGMGFQLLSIDLTLKFWHSVYYIGHLVLPIFGLIGLIVLKRALNFILPSRLGIRSFLLLLTFSHMSQ